MVSFAQEGEAVSFLDLLDQIKDPHDVTKRAAAAQALGKLRDRIAIPALLEALKDPHFDVRDNAAYALAELGDPSVAPTLLALLRDPSRQIRKTAAKGLGMLRAAEGVDALTEALGDSSYLVRKSAIRSLGQIGGLKAIQALRDALTREKEPVLLALLHKTLNAPAQWHRPVSPARDPAGHK